MVALLHVYVRHVCSVFNARWLRSTYRAVRIDGVRDGNVAGRRRAKALHGVADSGADPALLARDDEPKGQHPHGADSGRQHHGWQAVLGLGVFAVPSCQSRCDQVDQPPTHEEGQQRAHQPGQREQPQRPKRPVVRRRPERLRRGDLDGDGAIGLALCIMPLFSYTHTRLGEWGIWDTRGPGGTGGPRGRRREHTYHPTNIPTVNPVTHRGGYAISWTVRPIHPKKDAFLSTACVSDRDATHPRLGG
jgi:hypothetical protein